MTPEFLGSGQLRPRQAGVPAPPERVFSSAEWSWYRQSLELVPGEEMGSLVLEGREGLV